MKQFLRLLVIPQIYVVMGQKVVQLFAHSHKCAALSLGSAGHRGPSPHSLVALTMDNIPCLS